MRNWQGGEDIPEALHDQQRIYEHRIIAVSPTNTADAAIQAALLVEYMDMASNNVDDGLNHTLARNLAAGLKSMADCKAA